MTSNYPTGNPMGNPTPAQTPSFPVIRRLMKVLAFIYAVVGMSFFFFSETVLESINSIASLFKLATPIPLNTEHFWVVLATSMMIMLVALSILSSRAPEIRGYLWVHLVSKVASSAAFFYLFFHKQPYFAYVAGIATDLPLALLILGFIIRITLALRTSRKAT
ncbi:hypothetical protein WDW86_08850 [Bdellovibrionota bacterium FG-2]